MIRRRFKGDNETTWTEGDVLINLPGSASTIDTALLFDSINKRTWLLVTNYAEGYGFPNT